MMSSLTRDRIREKAHRRSVRKAKALRAARQRQHEENLAAKKKAAKVQALVSAMRAVPTARVPAKAEPVVVPEETGSTIAGEITAATTMKALRLLGKKYGVSGYSTWTRADLDEIHTKLTEAASA